VACKYDSTRTVPLGCGIFGGTNDGPEALDRSLSSEEIASIRAGAVDVTICPFDAVASAGVRFPGTTPPHPVSGVAD